ncbi:MAG TPA: hypothetical protein VM266_05225 [Solirubrobacteraceae bacterium]|nr:hypothetical protein [Solirubrobacteraceae bacterium]
MSAPTVSRPRLARPRPPAPAAPAATAPVVAPWRALVAGCVALAALSLLLPSAPTYDPWSWIIWGREVAGGELVTTNGPSWKPLPVLFTTPFSLFGDGAAPLLWLVVARAGGLLGIALAARLAARVAGPVAGAAAGIAVAASDAFLYHAARGNSEGLLVGLTLWAVERHLDGRRASAFVLGTAAALLRPELWPFWGLYGLWLAWRHPRTRALVAAGFAAVPLLWFVPEWLGSGDFLRAASRARQPNLDSPAYAPFPALEVVKLSLQMLPLVTAVGAVACVGAALRRRQSTHDRMVLAFAAAAVTLVLGVAAMTQGGFSGNLRYVLLPVAFVCVLGAAGWVEAVRAARRHLGRAAAVALAAVGFAGAAWALAGQAEQLDGEQFAARREALAVQDLSRAVAGAGGAARINGCGTGVFTTRFQVPLVAWTLGRHLDEVEIFPFPPGAALAPKGSALSRDPRFVAVARTTRWAVRMSCDSGP